MAFFTFIGICSLAMGLGDLIRAAIQEDWE